MTTAQQTPHGSSMDMRWSLLGVLWKAALGAAIVVAIIVVSSRSLDWRWLLLPGLLSVGSLSAWQLLRRDLYVPAAWSFVVLGGLAILAPLPLISSGPPLDVTARVLMQGLPFASLLFISLAGTLLPPWSTLLIVGLQVLSTVVLPFLLAGGVEPMHVWAVILAAVGSGLAWLSSGPLSETANWAVPSYKSAEMRAEELRQSRDELERAVRAQDALNEQLRVTNTELERQTAQLEASSEVSRLVTSTMDLDQLLAEVSQVLADRFAALVAMFLLEGDGEWLALRSVHSPESAEALSQVGRLPVSAGSSLGLCVLHNEIHEVSDTSGQASGSEHLLPSTLSEVCVPLVSRGQVLGVLNAQSDKTEAFDARDQLTLTLIADQMAGAVENLRSFAETRRALDEVWRLQRRYVQEAWERFAPQLEAAGYRYSGGGVIPLGHRPLPEVSEILNVGRTIAEPGRGLIAPISLRGQVIGALGLQDPDEGREWTNEDINLVESVARQMSVVIDNARLVEETQQSLSEITDLNKRYMRQAWEEFLPTRKANDFVFAQPGVPREDPLPEELESVLTRNEPLALRRGENGNGESTLLAPITLREQIVGALGLQELGDERDWTDDELELVDAVAAQMSWAIENARLFEETEHRAYELEKTAEQLRETDLFRAQFLANMSHELRTPLNSIIGFSRVILKGIDGPLTDLQKTDLEAIYSNGQHLLTMINEVLDMSKIEAGKMELVIENVDLNVLVRGVVSTSTALVKDKAIELRTKIQEELPIIRADGTRIRQVITNLMSNAAKFTEEGSITLGVWTDEEMVYVSVEDTGEGIPDAKIPLVFEAFRQVDGSSTRRAEGTGLGLPISRQFVEMHGGRIWLESVYGTGTTFTFCIPIEGPTEVVSELAHLQVDGARKLLLVVERSEEELTAYQAVLGDEYQLVGLYDSREVVRWTRYLRPWAILMDVETEGRAVWDALETLKSMRATRSYPVVVCSELDEAGQAISMGAVAYVSKPLDADEFGSVLGRLAR